VLTELSVSPRTGPSVDSQGTTASVASSSSVDTAGSSANEAEEYSRMKKNIVLLAVTYFLVLTSFHGVAILQSSLNRYYFCCLMNLVWGCYCNALGYFLNGSNIFILLQFSYESCKIGGFPCLNPYAERNFGHKEEFLHSVKADIA